MLGKEKIFPEFVQYIPLFLLKHNKYWKYSMILIKPRNNFFYHFSYHNKRKNNVVSFVEINCFYLLTNLFNKF